MNVRWQPLPFGARLNRVLQSSAANPLNPNPSPMYLERLLQINMATLAALGALLLGMGERSEVPPLLVMLAAALSVWLTDVTGKFRIGRWTGNVLMLIGAVVALHDAYPPRSEMQTVGLCWFLIYLQVILLFQQKDQWKYWLLIMLSLLEVVMATLFSQGVGFGVLLAVYMLLGFSAMTLLMLYRQWECRPKKAQPEVPMAAVALQPPIPQPHFPRKPRAARWPLSGQQSDVAGQPAGSSHAGVGRGLFRHLGKMGVQTMVLTMLMFFALPRFGHVAWRKPIIQPQTESLVGFTDKVKLGELGRIVESREEVMRVWFYPGDSTVSERLGSDVYLQGAYLMTYKDGQWDGSRASCEIPSSLSLAPGRVPRSEDLVRQKIRIEGLDRKELFYVAPFLPIERENAELSFDLASQRLTRSSSARRLTYTLGTTAIVDKQQLPLVPAAKSDLPNEILAVPRRLPGLRKLAKRWIEDAGLKNGSPRERAQYLEHGLATSKEFQYSLTGVERDTSIDPIEDFVTKHGQGNCEYFATALTLMLRTQGIPARMVSGFKVDNDAWNSGGGYYQVRQLHAHTWVEAYLPDRLPDDMKHAKDYWVESDRRNPSDSTRCWESGGWLRLDPTPGGARRAAESWFAPVRSGFDWLEGVWSKFVVELDFTTQRDAIYQPIARGLRQLWEEITSASSWENMFDSVAVALYLDSLSRGVRWVLLVLIAVVFVGLSAGVAYLLFRIGRRRWARRSGNHRRRRGRRPPEVAFYRRFEHLMAREGLIRGSSQTQWEFAAAAGAHFASTTGDGRLAALPMLVANAFYRVRFGQAALDSLQAEEVDRALAKIAAIRKNRPT
jgi:protein-glutamine gamma-glutamyltransferase